ncbi:MAG: response regulator [Anaerolineae bacterium]|nr:MAG: response regulator [Anaerolineae bacterium]
MIVDDDVETLRLVGLMLERQGYLISAADNGARAIQKAIAERPDIILLDVMMPDMSGVEVAKRLRARPETADVPIIMFTAKSQVEDKVEGLEAGADAYLTKPTQPRELLAQVKALLNRTKKMRSTGPIAAPAPRVRGHTIGVLSAKGGVGVTTVATNLAVTIRKLTGETVIVADYRPGTGGVGLSLGFNSSNGIRKLLRQDAKAITEREIKNQVSTHSSGIQVFLAPDRPREAIYFMRIEQYRSIAKHLPFLAKFVIFDLGPSLPPVTQAVMEHIDEFIVVVDPSPDDVEQTKALLEDLNTLGVGPGRVRIVMVNRQAGGLQLTWSQMQEELDLPIAVVITPAPELAFSAHKAHLPMVLQQPNGLTAEQFTKLAAGILELVA